MAFGTSWGCTRYADEQIGSRRVASIGELDEAIFHVDRPDLAKAVWYLLDVGAIDLRQRTLSAEIDSSEHRSRQDSVYQIRPFLHPLDSDVSHAQDTP